MQVILDKLRLWLHLTSPTRRLALRKRELEAVCRRHGTSRTQATGIAAEFLK